MRQHGELAIDRARASSPARGIGRHLDWHACMPASAPPTLGGFLLAAFFVTLDVEGAELGRLVPAVRAYPVEDHRALSGRGNHEALGLVAAHAREHSERIGHLHALGNNLETEVMREVNR